MDAEYFRKEFLKIITDGLKVARRPGTSPENKRAAVLAARFVLRRKVFTMEEIGTSEEELSSIEKIVTN